jgi:hypothetical protein
MPDRFSDRSPDRPSEDDLRAHAAFEAGRSSSGIGAAVTQAGYSDGELFWECIVSDGREWHFIRVLSGSIFRPPKTSRSKTSSTAWSDSRPLCRSRTA